MNKRILLSVVSATFLGSLMSGCSSLDRSKCPMAKKENPEIVVLFEVYPDKDGRGEYVKFAKKLVEKLKKVDGFISIERFKSLSNDGKILSMSVWRDEKSLSVWRNQLEHREGQKAGHDKLFKSYRIRVASVIRDYTKTERTQAPTDSNEYIYNKR